MINKVKKEKLSLKMVGGYLLPLLIPGLNVVMWMVIVRSGLEEIDEKPWVIGVFTTFLTLALLCFYVGFFYLYLLGHPMN